MVISVADIYPLAKSKLQQYCDEAGCEKRTRVEKDL